MGLGCCPRALSESMRLTRVLSSDVAHQLEKVVKELSQNSKELEDFAAGECCETPQYCCPHTRRTCPPSVQRAQMHQPKCRIAGGAG